MAFSNYLKEVLVQKGISLYELSARTGIDSGHLSRIVTGKRPAPKAQTLREIASAIGEPYENLLEAAGYLSHHEEVETRATTALARMDPQKAEAAVRQLESLAVLYPKQEADH